MNHFVRKQLMDLVDLKVNYGNHSIISNNVVAKIYYRCGFINYPFLKIDYYSVLLYSVYVMYVSQYTILYNSIFIKKYKFKK